MRSTTCSEYVRGLAELSEYEGDPVNAANLRQVAELLDVHGCASANAEERDTERVKILEEQCPRCGWVTKGGQGQ